MNQQNILLRISQLLSRFSEQVKILNSNSEFSINVHAENILIKILNVIFDCDLKNVNYEENKNYPSIDLRDENKRIAIQVTSTSTLEKVKHTLSQFVSNNLYADFDQLYIYIITEKKGKYNQEIINRITEGKFEFSSDHIIDKKDLYLMLNEQNDLQKINNVCELLELQFSDNKSDNAKELDKWEIYFKGLSEYDDYISRRFKSIEIKGVSPKINSDIVQIDIDKIYVPLKFKYDLSKDSNNIQSKNIRKLFDIAAALERFDKIVILGDPGSGKSTSLKYLAYDICTNRATHRQFSSFVPIFIKASEYANDYSDTRRSLSEYIIGNTQYGTLFSKYLENNSLVILFDGLDEINNTHQRHIIVDKLNSFIAQYPNIKIVVSSRIVGYNETRLSGDFCHFEVDKFSDKQIQTFLNNWFSAIYSDDDTQKASDDAEALFNSIKQNDSVYRLACNPLLVTIIALIYKKGRKLPEKRASLYDYATSTLLDNWVQLRTTPSNNIDRELLIELLAPISFYIHERYSTGLIPERELRQLLINEYECSHSYLQPIDVKKVINDIISFLRQDAGFLYEKGFDENDEELFGFVHLSFQEYFAAIEFKDKWEDNDNNRTFELSEYIFDSNWTEVIKLTASLFKIFDPRSGRKKATKFITDILNIDEMIPELNRPLAIVCQILIEDVEIEFEVFIKIIDKIINTSSVNEPSDVWWGEWYITKLLYTTNYQKYLLDRLFDNIGSDPSSVLSKRSIRILMHDSDIPAVKDKLLSILESGQVEIKKQMFEYNVIWPLADIVKTDVFRAEILKYINSSAYSNTYNGHLPSQYNLCFKDHDVFSNDDISDDEVLDDWLLSIRLITDLKMKEDLIDFYVFSWGTGDVSFFRKYYEAVKNEYPDFKFEKIKSYIDKQDKYESYGIGKYPIASFNDIKIFEKKGEESTYAIINNEEVAFVGYPFDYKTLESFFGTQTKSIVDFLNIIIANRSETKELLIHNDSELDTVINYWNHIDSFFHLNVNKAINYAFSVLFNDGVANEKYLNWLTRVINGNHRPIIIESSLNIDELEQRIKSSSINIFDKLLLLKTIKPDFNDKVLLSIAITEFKEEKSPSKKEDYLSILRRII